VLRIILYKAVYKRMIPARRKKHGRGGVSQARSQRIAEVYISHEAICQNRELVKRDSMSLTRS
jgi:hypothetical protein